MIYYQSRYSKIFLPIFIVAILLSAPAISSADNGEVVFAFENDSVTVDGDLTDWPKDCPSVPMNHFLTNPTDSKDLSASFKVFFSSQNRKLFIGVTVIDDVHVATKDKPALSSNIDRLSLYLDLSHSKRGSGPVLFSLAQNARKLYRTRKDWNPHNQSLNWDTVEAKVKRVGKTTCYEWAIQLNEGFAFQHKTIGFDLLVTDADQKTETNASRLMWGKLSRKVLQAGRAGDFVFAERKSLGTVRGKTQFASDFKFSKPSRIKIESTTHPEFWLQTNANEKGEFSVQLPAGDYRISLAESVTAPFQVINQLEQRKLSSSPKQFKVSAGKTLDIGAIQVETQKPPYFPSDLNGPDASRATDYASKMTKSIKQFQKYYGIPGVSVAIVKDNQVIYHKALGIQNNLTQKPVTQNTLFEAASTTKAVFAFAVMRLVEKDLIDLDKPLHRYAPFKNIADDPRSKSLTARHILTHSSGLPNWAWGGPGGWEGGKSIKLSFQPGKRFQYSGEAFNYLGRVVESVSKKKLADVFQKEVADTFGLKQTWFCDNKKLSPVSSLGHFGKYCAFDSIQPRTSPASSMHTEASDFSNFLIGLLKRQGLKPSSYDKLFGIAREFPRGRNTHSSIKRRGIGLGFFVSETELGPVIEHGGSNGDFHCKFVIVPKHKFAFAIFTNSNTGHNLVQAFERCLLNQR